MERKLTTAEKHYFDRHLKLAGFGEDAQQRLRCARVLIVGAGGLGCPVLQYLTTAGVGHIGVIDPDTVSYHNLHRQVLFSPDDVGKGKAETVVRKLSIQQPLAHFSVYNEALSLNNALALIGSYDVIVDGTDNFETRYLVNDACVIQGKPLVSGAIDRYTGQVSVFNYQGGPTYRCLYPDPPDECGSCSIDGVLNVLPGIIGTLMANEVLKVASGYGEVLSGKLLVMDTRENGFQLFGFTAIEANKGMQTLLAHYNAVPMTAIIPGAPMPHIGALLVDVREPWEYDEGHGEAHINIPLHELPHRAVDLLEENRPIVFFCPTGKRSRMAVEVMKPYGVEVYAERLR